jgi:hypothetical protein
MKCLDVHQLCLIFILADIEKYGNDPSNVGVDGILKKYIDKFDEYDKLIRQNIRLTGKITGTLVKRFHFTYRDRKGIEETITGTVEGYYW